MNKRQNSIVVVSMNHESNRNSCIRLACISLLVFILMSMTLLAGCSRSEDNEESDENNNSDYVVLEDIPDWDGDEERPYIEINGNVPEFEESEISWAEQSADSDVSDEDVEYEVFGIMDKLGRCGSAIACVCEETMPEGERGSIGMIRPSGWQLDKYDFIDNGGYLYNRCHLIGWQLTGQNDEERNLITGTRYMNTAGMLPFENEVAEYVRATGNHVLYRVTPIFKGKELLARGVEMEAYSLEDEGIGVSFNVFCYNVQPGVSIDYKTGENELDESTLPAGIAAGEKLTEDDTPDGGQIDSGKADGAENDDDSGKADGTGNGDDSSKADGAENDNSSKADGAGSDDSSNESDQPLDVPDGVTYILNTNTMRFHRIDCKGAQTIKEHNREWFYGTRDEAMEKGFVPCGMCNP